MSSIAQVSIKRRKERITAYSSAWGLERTRSSAKEARIQLNIAADTQLQHAATLIYRRADDGTVFAFYYLDGWCYDIVGTEHTNRGYPCTVRLPVDNNQSEALATMERHVASYAGPGLRKTVQA